MGIKKSIFSKLLICLTLIFVVEAFENNFLNAQCAPGQPVVMDITPTGATLSSSSSCCSGIYYWEYGLTGFTPGVDSLPGTGGTVVHGTGNIQYATGLTPSTLYDCYLRRYCNNAWTANSVVAIFRTAENCANAQLIYSGYNYLLNLSASIGTWHSSCFFSSWDGMEKIYRFTAPVTGTYTIFLHNDTGTANPILFSYKADSLGCSVTNWNCISNSGWWNQSIQANFGILTAGVTYLIRATASLSSSVSNALTFRIECPWNPQPVVNSVSTGIVSADVNTTSSFDYVEYGPIGFMPGITANPGPGGTISYSTHLSNLQAGTGYDVYIRNYNEQNSLKKTFYTLSCLNPTTIYSVDVLTSLSSSTNYNYYSLCSAWPMPGQELRAKFTSPKTNYYEVELHYYGSKSFGFKNFDNICSTSSYNCQTPYLTTSVPNSSQYISYYMVGPLNAGDSYDLMFDQYDTIPYSTSVAVNCPRPKNITVSNIQPHSIDFSWSCNCPDTTFLEYGFKGFTPGTTDMPGTNGTLITGISSPYTLTGLQVDTTYDIYFRTVCGGQFSKNTKLTQRTAYDCSNAQTVNCGDFLKYEYKYRSNFPPENYGAWLDTSCGNAYSDGTEKVFRFTPTFTGNYTIFLESLSSLNYNNVYPVNFYYKADSALCNEANWICIGSKISNEINFVRDTIKFGPLMAGVPYMILVDGFAHHYHNYKLNFRFECPNVCSTPILYNAFLLNPTSAVITAPLFFQDYFLEYGTSGFTPGIDSLPGVGGTIIHPVTFPDTISNLQLGVSYDVYLRGYCDTLAGFSANTPPKTFYTCSLQPGIIGPPPFCAGDSVTLQRTGGILAPGGVYAWYKDSCGGTFLSYGDSIKILPTGSTYYLRAEASCGNSVCSQIQPMPSTPNPTLYGDTVLCVGDSSVLNAPYGFTSYLWSTGDTTKSTVIYSAGTYTLTVINATGCVGSKNITVTVDPGMIPIITGDSSICIGDSITLDAGAGYNWYLWSTGDSTQTINLNTAGTYIVTVCDSNGCIASSNVTTTIDTLPIVSMSASGSTRICLGDTVTLSAPFITGWGYQWFKNNNIVPGAVANSYGAFETGIFKVQGFDLNGCSNFSLPQRVTVVCYPVIDIDRSANEISLPEDSLYFTIYQTPVTDGHLVFIYNSDKKENNLLELIDVSGRVVFSASLFPQRAKQIITLPDLSSGLYNCIFTSGDRKFDRKVALISP